MKTILLKIGTLILATSSLCACTTVGGFEAAQKPIEEFVNGAEASKVYITQRNKAQLRSTRELSLMSIAADAKNDAGDLTPSAKTLICNHYGILYNGAGELVSIQLAARNFSRFNYKESDKILQSLRTLSANPSAELPELQSFSEIDEQKFQKIAEKRKNECSSDFDYSKTYFEVGSREALIPTNITNVVDEFNSVVKPKAIEVINILISYRRRKLLNSYIKENETELNNLKQDILKYAAANDLKSKKNLKTNLMINYILAVEKFALNAKSKSTYYSGIFTTPVIDLKNDRFAKEVILSAEAYDSAALALKANSLRSLAASIDNLLALTKPGSLQDHYNGIKAAEEFINAAKDLANAIDDSEFSAALSEF